MTLQPSDAHRHHTSVGKWVESDDGSGWWDYVTVSSDAGDDTEPDAAVDAAEERKFAGSVALYTNEAGLLVNSRGERVDQYGRLTRARGVRSGRFARDAKYAMGPI